MSHANHNILLPSLHDTVLNSSNNIPDLVDLESFVGDSYNPNQPFFGPGFHSGEDSDFAESVSDYDSESDEEESSELIPRSIKRDEQLSIRQTIAKLGEFRQKDKDLADRLGEDNLLETQEQDSFINNLKEQSRVMASLWRFVCLFCTTLWACLIGALFLIHAFYDVETFNFHHAHTTKHIGTGLYLVLEFIVLLSSFLNIAFAWQIPRFTDGILVITCSFSIIAFIIYTVALFMVNALTLFDSLIPFFNLMVFVIVGYAYYSIQSLHWEVHALKKCKYNYQAI